MALAVALLAAGPAPGPPSEVAGAPVSAATTGMNPHQEPASQEAPAEAELPPAREVIDRYVEAIGGEELIRSFESRRATGTFEVQGQGLGGTVAIHSAAPDRLLVELEYEGVGAVHAGFDGEVGWSIDPITGPRVLSGQELEQLRDEADFYGDLHDPSRYASVETMSREEFAGHDTWKIRLERPSGRVYFEYYDVDSGLMVGNEGEQASMMGTLQVVSVIDGYQEFGGLLIATRVTQDFGMGQEAVTLLQTVEHDTVADEVFALPQEIQALLQQ